MTAFDDDPEYEAQLKDVLGDQHPSWREDDNEEGEQERAAEEFAKDADDESVDSVLDDAPTFRLKLPPHTSQTELQMSKDEEELSTTGIRDGRALSEDARSISTGDDSPSAQARCGCNVRVNNRGLR